MPAHFTNIPYPAADADAANKKYVDDQTGGGGGGGGIPAGGTTGQQLTKVSGADFDVDWEAAGGTGGGAGIPVGGSTGQQLTKDSSADFDVSWQAAGGGGGGGGVWNGVNHQTGTSYFVVVGDDSKLLTFSNASPVSVILPPPGDFEVVDGFDVDHSLYVYLSYFTPSVGPPIGGISGYGGVSQSFTPSVSAFLTKASFSIRKHGSPTGTAVAKLYTHSGTYGSTSVPGTLLATSDTLDVSTVSATGGFVNLLFSTPYSMVSGTPYVISIESTAGDSSNYLEIPLAFGTYGGTWAAFGDAVWSPHGATAFASYDLIFAVYTGGSGIGDTWVAYFENLGAGLVTISAPFSAIDDIYSVGLRRDTGIIVACDGSSYYTCRGVGFGTERIGNTVRLPSDFTTSSLSLVDVTGLSLGVGANHLYELEATFCGQSSTNAGLAVGIFYSAAGATGTYFVIANATLVSAVVPTAGEAIGTVCGTNFWDLATTDMTIKIWATIKTAANAGNIKVQMKKITGGSLTVYKGSRMTITQMD